MNRFVLQVMLLITLAIASTGHGQADDPFKKDREKAKAAMKAAIPLAKKDTARPVFHYRPPAQWMNDICGAIYYKGYYHAFYQCNPHAADSYGWGWGHARSKDLVHWEELPWALLPMKHRGERRCNSGCVALDGNGRPMIFYTFVPTSRRKRTQWGVIPLDDGLIKWRRVKDEPLMTAGKNGVPEDVPGGWSDPYVFKSKGRTFVTFKACGGLVCEATNKTLTEWKYVDRLEGVVGECPNVFRLQDQWVIIRSTYPTSYVIGALVLDANDIRFNPSGSPRVLDYSYGKNKPKDRVRVGLVRGLYGTNTLIDPKGRRIMFGWVSGFKGGRGWNGCMSLPRILTIDKSGQLIQTPAPELKELRGKHQQFTDVAINNEFKLIKGVQGNTLEIMAEFIPGNATAFGLKVRSSRDGKRAITLKYADGTLNVAGTKVPMELGKQTKTLKLHMFLDRSVMEVFINGGKKTVTRVEYPGEADLGIAVFAENGRATLKSLDVWQMKPIW